MNFLQNIMLVWEKVSMTQRVLLVTVVVAAVAGGGLLLHWARRPDMQMLVSGLEADEAGKIVDLIQGKDIVYELKSGGSRIDVPREHVYQLRLDIFGKGLMSSQNSGYSLFDNQKIGISPLVENVNLLRAKQTELARTIQMIDGVQTARVHIVDSERNIFKTKESQIKASVTLNIRPGYQLTPENIGAITNLVAASVTDLTPENVTIVDSRGRLLSNHTSDQFLAKAGTRQDYKERVEQNLEQKAEDMLTMILGRDRAMVKVSAVIDTNNLRVRSETETPGEALSEETTDIKEPVTSTVSTAGGASGMKSEKTEKTEYSKEVTITEKSATPGEIVSLSVSVVVDLRPPDVNDPNAAAATPVMDITAVEELVKNALGLKTTDVIAVQNLPIYRTPVAAEETSNNWSQYIEIAERSSLGIMSVCALLVFMIFRRARKKAGIVLTDQAQLTGGSAGLLGEGIGKPALDQAMVQERITAALRNNPDQVKQIFSSWISEGK
jgi:flagellar M-ring protein FliF